MMSFVVIVDQAHSSLVSRRPTLKSRGITLFTLIHDPINGKPDIIVLYQARDNAYCAQISAHAQYAGCFFRLYW